jgi:hypothetical protein
MLIVAFYSEAQQFVYLNQFYGTSQWQNPSLTGLAGQSRIQSSFRSKGTQSVNSISNTYYLSGEIVNKNLPLDIGFFGLYDDNFFSGVEDLYLGVSFSRAFKLSEKTSLRLGVSGNFVARVFQFSNTTSSGSGGLLNGGFTLVTPRLILGYNAFAINRPSISLSDMFSIQYKLTHHLNASYQIWKSDPEDSQGLYSTLTYINSVTSLIGVNLIYRYKKLKGGFGYFTENSYCFYSGIALDKFSLNYSYQVYRGKLINELLSNHQITLNVLLGDQVERARGSKLIQSLF